MSIHDLLQPNPYDIFANTITVASGVIPPPLSAPTFTVGPPGPLTVIGTTNLTGGLNVTGNSSISGDGLFGPALPAPFVPGSSLIVNEDQTNIQNDLTVGGDLTVTGNVIGLVKSFEGRSGVVVSAIGDYTASEITNIPSGSLVSTDIQSAIGELNIYAPCAFATGTSGATATNAGWIAVPITLNAGQSRSNFPGGVAATWANTPGGVSGTTNGIQGLLPSSGNALVSLSVSATVTALVANVANWYGVRILSGSGGTAQIVASNVVHDDQTNATQVVSTAAMHRSTAQEIYTVEIYNGLVGGTVNILNIFLDVMQMGPD